MSLGDLYIDALAHVIFATYPVFRELCLLDVCSVFFLLEISPEFLGMDLDKGESLGTWS